jgi:uncharacterized protein YozE (UPF0346 family)
MTTYGFTIWLTKQRNRDDPTGDLARDMRRDLCWPRKARSLATFRTHLEDHNADPFAIEALEGAWAEWQSQRATTVV